MNENSETRMWVKIPTKFLKDEKTLYSLTLV